MADYLDVPDFVAQMDRRSDDFEPAESTYDDDEE